jgi:hypothetical protein
MINKNGRFMKGHIPFSKGLTKFDHPGIMRNSLSKIGENNPSKRIEVKEKMSIVKKNNPSPNEFEDNHKGYKYWLGKRRPEISGKNNNFWKGGITSLSNVIRNFLENKIWTQEVFERDKYTCQECFRNKEISGHLEAHHIKRFSIILEEFLNQYSQFSPIDDKEILARLAITYKPFWNIDNGQTLCKYCHNKTRGKKCLIKNY